jgi:DNA polymerase III alpha subunit
VNRTLATVLTLSAVLLVATTARAQSQVVVDNPPEERANVIAGVPRVDLMKTDVHEIAAVEAVLRAARERLAYEIGVIQMMGFSGYFL